VSENYKFYVRKMAERQAGRTAERPLRNDLKELLEFVQECESRWALEDRISQGFVGKSPAETEGSRRSSR